MEVHAIKTGTVAVKTRQPRGRGRGQLRFLNTLLDREWTEPLPIWAWVIEHPAGLLVIDSGETSRADEPGYFPRWHPYFRLGLREWVRPEEEIGPQMRALGLDPADVRWVVMTHLHTDHAGGLEHFPRSEIVVSRDEFSVASGKLAKPRGYLPHRWPGWFQPRLLDFEPRSHGPFPESASLEGAEDVRIVATRGHSPGHMSVAVEEDGRTLFFAGDTSYSEQLMLEGVVDGVAPDQRAAGETLERLNAFVRSDPVVYLPSHDPDSGARLAERRVAQP